MTMLMIGTAFNVVIGCVGFSVALRHAIRMRGGYWSQPFAWAFAVLGWFTVLCLRFAGAE